MMQQNKVFKLIFYYYFWAFVRLCLMLCSGERQDGDRSGRVVAHSATEAFASVPRVRPVSMMPVCPLCAWRLFCLWSLTTGCFPLGFIITVVTLAETWAAVCSPLTHCYCLQPAADWYNGNLYVSYRSFTNLPVHHWMILDIKYGNKKASVLCAWKPDIM